MKGFEIPYISLPHSTELHQITDIFERINSTGKKLSSFDLLTATLSKYEIDLKLWEEALRRYPRFKDYDRLTDKMPIYLLQAISLYYHKANSCKREDILNIFQNIFEPTGRSFEDTWRDIYENTAKAISKLENLRDSFGVNNENELPFSSMIPILAALIKEIELRKNRVDCYKKLSIWYWSSVFTNAYSGAVDSQLSANFKEMREWFSNTAKVPRTVAASSITGKCSIQRCIIYISIARFK
jgi:hypothetical protein